MPEAMGIPSLSKLSDPSKLKVGELVDYNLSSHNADRAGPHNDLRLGTKKSGLQSWVVRKGLPGPGEKRLAIVQPEHEHSYEGFTGPIESGYGKGTVEMAERGKALIVKANPDRVTFVLASKKRPEEYNLIKTKNGNWLINNTTFQDPGILKANPKESYDTAQPEDFEELSKTHSTSAKIDGALALIWLKKNKARVFSHRINSQGLPIEHTHRIGGLMPLDIPKGDRERVLKGEIYGERKGEAIPPQELGGILNSTLENSLNKQREQDVNLKLALFKDMGIQKKASYRPGLPRILELLRAKKKKLVVQKEPTHPDMTSEASNSHSNVDYETAGNGASLDRWSSV